jgi:hypothetical protein
MMKRRLQSKIPENRRGSRRNNGFFPRAKKSCAFATCVVIGVFFSIRRTLNFRYSLNQWSSLSAVMTETDEAVEKSGSIIGGANSNSNTTERAVYLLEAEASELSDEDLATGMWWQSVASFSDFPVTKLGSRNQSASGRLPEQDSEDDSKSSDENRETPESPKDEGDEIIVSNGEKAQSPRGDSDEVIVSNREQLQSPKDDSDEIIVSTRNVSFMKRPEFQLNDPYSGMWWQDLEHFHLINAGQLGHLEAASFIAFHHKRGSSSRVRMTRDWFDLAVEHLSMYHRHFRLSREKTGIPFERIKSQLLGYIQKAKAYPLEKDAAPASTIVLCAFNVKKMMKKGPHYHTGENENQVRIHSLAATLASLWQVGMGRIVVVGGQAEDEEAAKVAFDLIRGKTNSSMELSFVISSNATTGLDDNDLTPKQAIGGLQVALNGKFNASHTQEWLGDNPKRWKYVYFTEPDLILSSRPGSISALSFQLQSGNILAGHRLQPIPHELDFPGFKALSKVVPAVGRFAASAITDVDTAEYACCDAGNLRPGRLMSQPECNGFWWQCGFKMRGKNYSQKEDVYDAHRRKVPYTWLRLSTGTGSVMMAATEHARQCTLIRHGSCEEAGSKKPVPVRRGDPAPALHGDVILRTLEIAEANMALKKKQSIHNRDTHLMRSSDFKPIDSRSGMWWVSIEGFMKFPNEVGSVEAASFAANREKNMILSVDWLDFAVEHLSTYHRHFDVEQDSNNVAYNILRKQMQDYMQQTQRFYIEDNLVQRETIAILPFTDNASGEKKRELRIDALAATMASLWQFGIGRVVVVGETQADEESANIAFDRLRAIQPTVLKSMEVAFAAGLPTKEEMVPSQAVLGLQMALQGHPNMTGTDIENWLGAKHVSNATRWKYVYYSEPDLVLNSRESAVPILTAAMSRGKMVAAHRLQPIPHALDFPGFDDQIHKIVPALGNFTHVYDMYADKSACCEAGNGRPGIEIEQKDCSKAWW